MLRVRYLKIEEPAFLALNEEECTKFVLFRGKYLYASQRVAETTDGGTTGGEIIRGFFVDNVIRATEELVGDRGTLGRQLLLHSCGGRHHCRLVDICISTSGSV